MKSCISFTHVTKDKKKKKNKKRKENSNKIFQRRWMLHGKLHEIQEWKKKRIVNWYECVPKYTNISVCVSWVYASRLHVIFFFKHVVVRMSIYQFIYSKDRMAVQYIIFSFHVICISACCYSILKFPFRSRRSGKKRLIFSCVFDRLAIYMWHTTALRLNVLLNLENVYSVNIKNQCGIMDWLIWKFLLFL